MPLQQWEKRQVSLRYWLQGREWFQALEALEFGKSHHTGVRKDGFTPEFDHQISIAHFVRTLAPSLEFPEETISTVFLHDVREDYGVSDEELRDQFGSQVANAVAAMTKTFRGERQPEQMVFNQIALDPIASIAKGADRIHNFNSMVGVFTADKQLSYIHEAETYFFPMLKKARRLHVRQEPGYENIRHMLQSQIRLIQAIHEKE
jgi:(p)ppGpp synthase/HD superfamily hydrolase